MPEFHITRLGRQGDGIAEGPVYVPRTLPGEIIEGIAENGSVTAHRILKPSDQRVSPPCRHFKSCGGCQMQHASDDLVASWKTDIIAHALDRLGLATEIRQIVTSPARSRRRAKFAARKTRSGASVGFHGRASDSVVDVTDCHLISPGLQAALPFLRAVAVVGASRKAGLEAMCTETLDGLDIAVTGGKQLDDMLRNELPALSAAHNVARLIWNGELVAQQAPPRHRLSSADVVLPPGAFLQATEHGESVLQACVLEAVGTAHRVADLFAGCGTFSFPLASRGPVTAVEGDKAMARALQDAANRSGLPYPIETTIRDLFGDPLTAEEVSRFDAVVIDPPRAGAVAQVAEIAKSSLEKLAYVSCDPGTFARDAAQLAAAGFKLKWVQPVDQFRWSTHLELASYFERA